MSHFLNEEDRQFLVRILARAAVDLEFRRRLLANPHAAVEEATGVSLSRTFKIRFKEQPKDLDALVVLPNAVTPAGALTDADLEAVAGGLDTDTDGPNGQCLQTCVHTCVQTCYLTCTCTADDPGT